MSHQKEFEKYLRGEYYPGAPKTPWRIAMEADFEKRGISFDSRPVPQKRVALKVVTKRTGCRLKGRTAAEYMKERRAKAIAEGICCDCYKEPSREGRTNCEHCQSIRTKREKNRWARKKMAA